MNQITGKIPILQTQLLQDVKEYLRQNGYFAITADAKYSRKFEFDKYPKRIKITASELIGEENEFIDIEVEDYREGKKNVFKMDSSLQYTDYIMIFHVSRAVEIRSYIRMVKEQLSPEEFSDQPIKDIFS